VPYLFDVAVEPFTHMPISTGLAAGPNMQACIHKGIMEILERDSLMVTWHARLPMPRIDPASCRGTSEQIDQLLSAAWPTGATWYLNLLTLDIDVPVISASLINSGSPPLTSFGIAADLDPERALLLALEEALLTRVLLNRSREILDDPHYLHERLQTLRDHLLAHATSTGLRAGLHFLTDEGPVIRFPQLVLQERSKTSDIGTRLAVVGLEAIYVDVTTPDVRSLGFRVVRTVIPGMQPLDNDHRYRHLGGRRLLSVPPRLGYPAPTPEMLNPDPHPFP
jgi:ribosomal protein S12 methylthiotransferase accessory factor